MSRRPRTGLRVGGWIVAGFMTVAVLDAGYTAGKLAGLGLTGTVLTLVAMLGSRSNGAAHRPELDGAR